MKHINVLLSRNRKLLMGIACLWIVFQHLQLKINFYPLWALGRFGFSQVDIFMLMSGFGVGYSLEKNRDTCDFIKRRFARIMPIYYPLVFLYFVYCIFLTSDRISMIDMLGVATCSSFWSGGSHVFSWYVHAIVLYYLLSPVFYDLMRRGKYIPLIVLSLCLSVVFVKTGLEIAIARLTSFLMGMTIALLRDNEKINEKRVSLISVVSFIVGLILVGTTDIVFQHYVGDEYNIIFLPLFLLPVGECLIFSWIANRLRCFVIFRKLISLIEFVGERSLEIYLSQTLFNLVILKLSYLFDTVSKYNCMRIAVAMLSICFAMMLHKSIELIHNKRIHN